MKKLFLALLAVASIGTANAQKNSVLVFGNAGYSFANNDMSTAGKTRTNTWNVTPGVGFQFNNHLTVGIQGGYMENKSVSDVTGAPSTQSTTRGREWQLGAFFRYTKQLSNIFAVYSQLDLSYVDGKTENDLVQYVTPGNIYAHSFDTYNGFQASIVPAIAVMVHKGLAMNFSMGGLGFRTISYDKAPTTVTSFGVTFGQTFNIGLSKNFGCHMHKSRMHHEPGMEHRKMKKHEDDEDDE